MTDEDVGTHAGETHHSFSTIINILLLYWEVRGLLEYGYMCRLHSEQFENFLLCFYGNPLAYGFKLQKQGKMNIMDASLRASSPPPPVCCNVAKGTVEADATWFQGWKDLPWMTLTLQQQLSGDGSFVVDREPAELAVRLSATSSRVKS